MAQNDSGFFQINDIALDIPPEQIQVTRRTVNNYWNTLRTRSSSKTRSGYANIDIICSAKFTDTLVPGEKKNGLQKLRAIIAQIRCTPFCWVDNAFIRSSILGNSRSDKAMVLALKNLEIHTVEGSVNTVEVMFKFSWFNYAPFVKDYSFKEDIFFPKRVSDPKDSKAWKLLYEAELSKGNYTELTQLNQNPNVVIDTDEFCMVPLEQYKRTKSELDALLAIQKALQQDLVHKYKASELKKGIPEPLYGILLRSLDNDTTAAQRLSNEILKDVPTSMFQEKGQTISAKQLMDFLKEPLKPRQNFVFDFKGIDPSVTVAPSQWHPQLLPRITPDGSPTFAPLQYSSVLDEKLDEAVKNQKAMKFDGQVLMTRHHTIDFAEAGLIITSMSISFENILATIPLIGHPYPTFQHIGSIDGVVTLSMATTSRDGIETLSNLYTIIEDQARKARQVPVGRKNLFISNGLVNMCGLRESIIEDLTISTVPGSPDTYQAMLTLVENPIRAETQEKLTPGQSFTTSSALRQALTKCITNHIKLDTTRFSYSGSIDKMIEIAADKKEYRKLLLSGKEMAIIAATFAPTFGGSLFLAEGLLAWDTLVDRYNGLYYYDGPTDDKNLFFAQLCNMYAVHLSNALTKIVQAFNIDIANAAGRPEALTREKGRIYKDFAGFFLLTNDDAPDVTRLQEDAMQVINNPEIDRLEVIFDKTGAIGSRSEEQDSSWSGHAVQRTAEEVQNIGLGRSAVEVFNILSAQQGDIPAALKEQAEAKSSDLRMKNQTVLAAFMDSYLKEWLKWAIPFLDGLSRCSNILTLSQFAEVQTLMKQNVLAEGADCYPDFPLDRVISMMEGKPKQYQSVLNYLTEVATRNQFGLKNINIRALINPDFFMYTPTDASVKDQVPFQAMNSARESIMKSHVNDRLSAEKDYLTTSYESLIGTNRAADQKKNSGIRSESMVKKDDDFWASEGINPEAKKAHDEQVKLRKMNNYFIEPTTLNGICGPSIYSQIEMSKAQDSGQKGKRIEPTKVKRLVQTITEAAEDKTGMVAINLRTEEDCTLKPGSYQDTVKHFLGDDGSQLMSVKEATLRDPSRTPDPNKMPQFLWPVSPGGIPDLGSDGKFRAGGTVVTLGFKIEDDNHPSGHQGIDIAAFTQDDIAEAQRKTLMLEAVAISSGNVIAVQAPDALKAPAYVKKTNGTSIEITTKAVTVDIQHTNGMVSRYTHLQWDEDTMALHRILNEGKTLEGRTLTEWEKEALLFRDRGQKIGMVGNTGFSTGPHLHFELRLNKGGETVDPLPYLMGDNYKSQGPLGWINPDSDSLFTKSVEQLDKEMFTAQGYSIMRAYPTFKLYFIESNLGRRRRYAFDDFFSFSAVQDITVIRNRKIPADLCILKLMNISGVLSNRKWRETPESSMARDESGDIARKNDQNLNLVNVNRRNAIASMMLQPGVQVQLRLGYSNNPEELEKVFNGIITEVEFSGTDDTVEITCQSYGVELVQNLYGSAKKYGGWFSNQGMTAPLLEDLMCAPEVVHFGRWEGGGGTNTVYGLLSQRWKSNPSPQDDNIFAPQHPGNALLSMGGLIDDKPYSVFNTTIWDVFQEMTLRHPGYVASAVPYEGKYDPARMTMFFGLPDQFYFARDPHDDENEWMANIKKAYKDQEGAADMLKQIVDPFSDKTSISSIRDYLNTKLMSNTEDSTLKKVRNFALTNSLLQFAQDSGFIKPFRSYHVLTSTNHIITNGIQSSITSAFNTVTLNYSDGTPSTDSKTASLEFSDKQSFTMSVDAAVPDEDKREMMAFYPNCIGFDLAKNYSIALLANSMKEGYKGNIVIIGNPKIKPYDICYIFDEYTDMYGPVEVEQVVHRFSQENGFITEITPNMCVHVNQMSTMTTMDAIGLMAEHKMRQMDMSSLPSLIDSMIDKGPTAEFDNQFKSRGIVSSVARKTASDTAKLAGMGLAIATFGVSKVGAAAADFVGLFLLRKYVTKAQTQQPLRYSPLTVQGMPMLGGIPARKLDGLFICGVRVGEGPSRWFKDTGRALPLYTDYVREQLYPNNWFKPVGEFW